MALALSRGNTWRLDHLGHPESVRNHWARLLNCPVDCDSRVLRDVSQLQLDPGFLSRVGADQIG